MYFSLEDAISCPPAFISISRRGNTANNTQQVVTQPEPEIPKANNSPEKKKDVLRSWTERPSIQAFMNTVLSMSLKRKQQQENLQQQLHEQEKQKQEQEQHLKQEIQQQKQQQFQLGKNPFTSTNSINSPTNDSLQLQGLAKETTSQTQNVGDMQSQESCSQRKPKVKKVMKGGVLVSIPCTRQPTGAKSVENNGEKCPPPFSNFKDKVNDFGGGNILDDILARAKDDQRAISGQNAGSKTHKKIAKSAESAVKICSKSSTTINPLIKEKINDPGRKMPGTDETSKPCISEQHNPKITEEISAEFDATDKKETKSLNGINEEGNADSLAKSINVEASKVNLSKDKETDGGSKENKIAPNKKRLQRLSRNLSRISKGKTAELKTSLTKSTGGQNAHSSSTSFLSVLQAKKREKEVMTGQETEAIGDTCDVGHESDNSVGTGELVIDCELVGTKSEDKSNLTFKKSKRRWMNNDSLTSTESSDDSDVQSSFNRIRALQYDNDVFINSVEACDEQSSTKEVPSLPDEDEKSLEEIQGMILHERKTKSNEMPIEKQQNMETNVTSDEYKVATAQISSINISDDCTMNQAKGLNDSVHDPDELMVVQTQSPEVTLTEEKNEEKERKRKGLLNEIPDSINTKRKRLIRMPFKNFKSFEPQVENNERPVTRLMSQQINSDKSPINKTKTQDSSQAALTCLPKNEDDDNMTKLEEMPSLLSMTSDEVLDVTVEENVKRTIKRKSKGKKRNKPTAWFLRKQQELKNNSRPSQYVQPAVCSFFLNGMCAQGNMCKFRHEKVKELCIYYIGHNGCYKWKDGMCPRLHDEFPCRFFHKKKFCLNEGNCKFSHEPLTKEMADILDNYLLTLQERYKNEGEKQSLESNGSVTEKSENEIQICSADKTGRSLNTASVPVSSQTIVNPLPDTNKLKYPVLSEASSKPADSPKVKRLCSLSSYKPQILPSLASSMKSLERSSSHELPRKCNPGDSPQTKADEPMCHFLPGIFKER